MSQQSDRPARKRHCFLTLELCVNKGAGPFGSVEIIESRDREPWVANHFWPLAEHGMLSALQVADLGAVVGKLLSETLYTRVHVQEEFKGVLST